MTPRRVSRILVLPVAAVVVMAAGIIGIALFTPQTTSFGWFAYAPLSGEVFSPAGAVVVGWGAIAGAAAVAIGLTALGFWAGFTLATARSK
ncbi:hypothetical protein [Herbiconiux liangxiaofengii]|uniref:hypothetical protein n=1 Tax=Herbiconiux liangxiaofengii TaxID=3342795 RepID=UPI0035B71AFC